MDSRAVEQTMNEEVEEYEDEDGLLRTLGELSRLPNVPSVCTNLISAWVISGGQWSFRLIPLLFGGTLLYAFGTALNDAIDARFDAEKRPERPLPSGRISMMGLWIFITITGLVGLLTITWLGGASVVWALTLIATIVAYDAVHKHWSGGCVLMGSCRWLLYFAGASAATGDLSFTEPVLLWATVLGSYIVGLTLYAREEADPEAPPVIRWPLLLLIGRGNRLGRGCRFSRALSSQLFLRPSLPRLAHFLPSWKSDNPKPKGKSASLSPACLLESSFSMLLP